MADGWQPLERADYGGWRLRAAAGFHRPGQLGAPARRPARPAAGGGRPRGGLVRRARACPARFCVFVAAGLRPGRAGVRRGPAGGRAGPPRLPPGLPQPRPDPPSRLPAQPARAPEPDAGPHRRAGLDGRGQRRAGRGVPRALPLPRRGPAAGRGPGPDVRAGPGLRLGPRRAAAGAPSRSAGWPVRAAGPGSPPSRWPRTTAARAWPRSSWPRCTTGRASAATTRRTCRSPATNAPARALYDAARLHRAQRLPLPDPALSH